jgi:TFIIF-interacting CTD phosphatase-like protein
MSQGVALRLGRELTRGFVVYFSVTNSSTKPLLILDLDETLIHSSEAALATPPALQFGPYFVYLRPCLSEFLASVAQQYRLAIWSSSSVDYVTGLVPRIFPPAIAPEFVWSRTRCVPRFDPEWQTQYWVKDLRKVKRLGYDLSRTLIVDDTPQKVERNYGNAIYVRSFEGDPADEELRALAPYLNTLTTYTEFRTLEKRNWRRAAND